MFSVMVIAGGSLTFLISWLGCWAANRENQFLLYTSSGAVREEVIKSMKKYPYYQDDEPLKIAIDKMQWHFACCGWEKGAEDWKENFRKYKNELPRSCCFDPEDENEMRNEDKLCTMKNEEHFKKGCAIEFEKQFLIIILIIFGCLTAVALIQFTAACFAWMLGSAIA
ncbi:CD63 antigen-like protein [Dinothrombium tinctorium]|uniref:CD63 antigen-like protein n=1 Tax=Dinothrombium tinctorium TaxID=1965070 RepID=A0A3S3P3F5_9ACAR|nr:CD63 antigen-like protein [Dinothrombium tinctorium]